MITGKYADLIMELSEGRSEITSKMVHDAETKLYFTRRRTLVDGKIPTQNKPSNYTEQLRRDQINFEYAQQYYPDNHWQIHKSPQEMAAQGSSYGQTGLRGLLGMT